ncbi:MAG: hypothetical protein CL927_13580 [Deltaproteobacteria bacterium]|nr:hypothetical protein [Deltaproteobacteria bacterium]HCH65686.1 hypothetical protein [Deltaproteobacteria bacterium]
MSTPFAILTAALTTMVNVPTADGWHRDAREVVDDRLVYALALERAGVAADEASVLYGTQYSYMNRRGDLRDRAGIGWTRLSGDALLSPYETGGDTRRVRCGEVGGPELIPGERQLVALPGRPRVETERPELTGGPEVVLATTGSRPGGDLQELAIVVVEPGDTVQVTTVHDRRDGDRKELIEYSRPTAQQEMVLYRDGSKVVACMKGTPPEAREDSRARIRDLTKRSIQWETLLYGTAASE